MRTYDKTTIAAVFSTVARLVREGKPVVLSQIEGLNSSSGWAFKLAVTHNFSEEKHGVNLQKIFIVDKEDQHCWRRNPSTPNNPKDIELVDRIIRAMTAVRQLQSQEREHIKSMSAPKEEKPKMETPKLEIPKAKLPILPGWETVLKEYPGIVLSPLFVPEELNNDAMEYAIQKTAYTLEVLKAEKEKRNTKKAELLRTIKELLSGEGFTLEDLLK